MQALSKRLLCTFFRDATASSKGKKSPRVNLGPDTIQLQVLQQPGSGGWVVLPFPCGVLRRLGNISSKLCFSPGPFEVIHPRQELCQVIILHCHVRGSCSPHPLGRFGLPGVRSGCVLAAGSGAPALVPPKGVTLCASTNTEDRVLLWQCSLRNEAFKYSRIDLKSQINSLLNTSSWILILCF